MKRTRREITVFSLSFLDCICCGFGSILLLFVLSMGSNSTGVQNALSELEVDVQASRQILASLQDQIAQLSTIQSPVTKKSKLTSAKLQQQLQDLQTTLNQEQEKLKNLEQQVQETPTESETQLVDDLFQEEVVPVGLPTDRTHLAFIIDTSGSMRNRMTGEILATVIRKIESVLNSYPEAKGIQFLTCNGRYMISQGRGKWLPDNPQLRQQLLQILPRYPYPSVSDPLPGIRKALKDLFPKTSNDRMGIFIFGDEFPGVAQDALIQIDKLNPKSSSGKRNVTISAIGFPNMLDQSPRANSSAYKYAHFMRELTQEHGGALILDRR